MRDDVEVEWPLLAAFRKGRAYGSALRSAGSDDERDGYRAAQGHRRRLKRQRIAAKIAARQEAAE